MSDLSQDQIDELLQALRTAPTAAGEVGVTAGEIAEMLRLNVSTVRDRLRKLLTEGGARCVKVKRLRMDGVSHSVSGYRIAG